MYLATANDTTTRLFFLIMTLKDLFTLENLNDAFYESSKISHWKEATQKYKSNLLINNIKLREEIINGKYKVSTTQNFIIRERGKIRNIQAPSQKIGWCRKFYVQKF